MAQAAELQIWRADVIRDMQQIGQTGGASKILRSVLQKHNRISSAIYLPTESDQKILRTGNPAEPARMMLEIFDLFIAELKNCNRRNYPWSREVGEDAFDLLDFQITKQFWIIKDCLVAACNMLHKKGAPLPLSYRQMTFSTYEDLGRHLEIQWKEAYHQVARFLISIDCVESSTYGDPDTVPVTTIRELIVRNELLKEDSSGISGGLKDKIFDAIEVAKRTSTIPDVSFLYQALRETVDSPSLPSWACKPPSVREPANMWASATLVIVADIRNKVIVTGGTKPAQINLEESAETSSSKKKRTAMAFLRDRAADICRARLGPRFADIINQCSRHFSEEAHKKNQFDNKYLISTDDTTTPGEIEDIYKSVLNWPKCTVHSQSHQAFVYSWAFDGLSLEAKPPCIRCTYLYSSWTLAPKPETVFEKRRALKQLRGHQMIYHNDKSPPCGYCAETTAAAQLFALDHGPIVCSG